MTIICLEERNGKSRLMTENASWKTSRRVMTRKLSAWVISEMTTKQGRRKLWIFLLRILSNFINGIHRVFKLTIHS